MANPTPYSDDQWELIRGDVRVQCVKTGGYTMTAYGQYVWAQDEVRSLFDDTLPASLRVEDYSTAHNMVVDPGYELAQRIAYGDFVLVEDRLPDSSFVQGGT